jgi:hypothetical protein
MNLDKFRLKVRLQTHAHPIPPVLDLFTRGCCRAPRTSVDAQSKTSISTWHLRSQERSLWVEDAWALLDTLPSPQPCYERQRTRALEVRNLLISTKYCRVRLKLRFESHVMSCFTSNPLQDPRLRMHQLGALIVGVTKSHTRIALTLSSVVTVRTINSSDEAQKNIQASRSAAVRHNYLNMICGFDR